MYNPFMKIQQNSLKEALKACSVAYKQGCSDAKAYLKELQRSINQASSIINECFDDMKKYHINDPLFDSKCSISIIYKKLSYWR